MFLGEYIHQLDQKGRLAVPIKFRAGILSGAILTKGLDGCLFLFNKNDWEELAKKINTMPLTKANARDFSRLMFSGAMEVDLDSQGRILMPDYLRQYAGLEKTCVVTGLYNRIEIWNEEKWRQYKSTTESNSGDIAEKLSELGI